MKTHSIRTKGRSAQDIQDSIFKRMSVDRKIELSSDFWKLAMDLSGKKFDYGNNRSKKVFGYHRQNSQ